MYEVWKIKKGPPATWTLIIEYADDNEILRHRETQDRSQKPYQPDLFIDNPFFVESTSHAR